MSTGNFVQEPPDPYGSDDDYPRQDPGLRLQRGPPGSAALFLADFSRHGIVGLQAMADRVSVINPKLAEVSFEELAPADTIHTYVYDPAVPATLVFDASGALVPEQFTVDISGIGGIGGTTTIAGFNVDALLVRMLEGDPLDDADPDHLHFATAPVPVPALSPAFRLLAAAILGVLGAWFAFGAALPRREG